MVIGRKDMIRLGALQEFGSAPDYMPTECLLPTQQDEDADAEMSINPRMAVGFERGKTRRDMFVPDLERGPGVSGFQQEINQPTPIPTPTLEDILAQRVGWSD